MRLALVLAMGTALTAGHALAAQAAPAKAKPLAVAVDPTVSPPGWKAPRNAMGQPDLSGYWSNATMTPLVRNGRFEGYLMSRETAATLGLPSNGCMRADGWNRIPLIRMTNVSLEPGTWKFAASR